MKRAIPPEIIAAVHALVAPYRPSMTTDDIRERLAAERAAAIPTVAAGPPRGYSVQRAAEICGVSRKTVRAWVRTGRLACVTLGHRTKRVPHDSLAALLGGSVGGDDARQN